MIYRSSGTGEYVSLNPGELEVARHCGAVMRLADLKANLRDKAVQEGGFIQRLGIVMERAIARALVLYWPDPMFQPWGGGDLPGNIEVRSAQDNDYGLRIEDHDPDDRRCVLIIFDRTKPQGPWRVPGWYLAEDARRHPDWRMLPPKVTYPCFVVPQEKLHPLSTLRALVHLEILACDSIAIALRAIGDGMARPLHALQAAQPFLDF